MFRDKRRKPNDQFKIEYHTCLGGRDIFADFYCDCNNKKYTDLNVHTKISLSGYYDDNFFDNVYKDYKTYTCSNCGRKYNVKWNRDRTIDVVYLGTERYLNKLKEEF